MGESFKEQYEKLSWRTIFWCLKIQDGSRIAATWLLFGTVLERK
jgi:hypothetical protein